MPDSSTAGTEGSPKLSFSFGGSPTSVANDNLEQTPTGISATSSDVNTDTDTSLGRPVFVFGNGSGEGKMSTAAVKMVEFGMSPSPSLVDMHPDLLHQVLGYAQPHEHDKRFEWSGLVGRTCKLFHQLSREDSKHYRGVAIDLSEFEKYTSIFPTTFRPRDLRLSFLRHLINDETMRARVDELHFSPHDLLYVREMRYRETNTAEDVQPMLDKSGDIVESLAVLLGRPNSFPNLHLLDIHHKDEGDFELFNRELLLNLPRALPKLDHLCLSNCFFSTCYGCVFHRPCAMTDVSVDQLVEFATSLKTPLRSLSLGGVPWMSDDHVRALLSVVGKDLRVLELIDCGLRHNDRSRLDPNVGDEDTPLSPNSLQAVFEHCGRLRILRVLGEDICTVSAGKIRKWDEALESVLRANPKLRTSEANDGLYYRWIRSLSNKLGILLKFEPAEGSKYAEMSRIAAVWADFNCADDPLDVESLF